MNRLRMIRERQDRFDQARFVADVLRLVPAKMDFTERLYLIATLESIARQVAASQPVKP